MKAYHGAFRVYGKRGGWVSAIAHLEERTDLNDLMEYKGYHTKPEYSAEDNCFLGKILGIWDSISFHGFSVEEYGSAFHEAVDDYLTLCEEHGKAPDKE